MYWIMRHILVLFSNIHSYFKNDLFKKIFRKADSCVKDNATESTTLQGPNPVYILLIDVQILCLSTYSSWIIHTECVEKQMFWTSITDNVSRACVHGNLGHGLRIFWNCLLAEQCTKWYGWMIFLTSSLD